MEISDKFSGTKGVVRKELSEENPNCTWFDTKVRKKTKRRKPEQYLVGLIKVREGTKRRKPKQYLVRLLKFGKVQMKKTQTVLGSTTKFWERTKQRKRKQYLDKNKYTTTIPTTKHHGHYYTCSCI